MNRELEDFIATYMRCDYGRIERVLLDQIVDDHDKNTIRAIVSCRTAREEKFNQRVAVENAMRLIDGKIESDPEIFSILAYETALCSLGSKDGTPRRLLNILKNNDQKLIRPDIRALFADLEVKLNHGIWSYDALAGTVSDGLKTGVTEGSYPWLLLLSNRIGFLSENLRTSDAEEDFSRIAPYARLLPKFGLLPIEWIRAFLYADSGRHEAALEVLDRAGARGTMWSLLRCKVLIRTGKTDEAGALLGTVDPDNFSFSTIKMLLHLAQREYAAARALAREIGIRHRAIDRMLNQLFRVLAEVELADGNAAAARRLLDMMDASEDQGFCTALWTRLYALEGDEAAAARHLGRLVEKNIPELVVDQFRFAHELSSERMTRLLVLAHANAGRRPVAPAIPPASVNSKGAPVFVGASPAACQIRELIGRYAPDDQTVLITGETGTGKEIVARLLHARSGRAAQPFVAVNCGSVSDTLIASELFGHVRGAFTGASQRRDGLFAAAKGGTIFLDEINSMSRQMQVSLLRALETGRIRPVGAEFDVRFGARVLAASNCPLDAAIEDGQFRSDLYYRLARLRIDIPPLAERIEDIPELTRHFVAHIFGRDRVEIAEDLYAALMRRGWPGNVRELENVLARMALFAGGRRILTSELLTSADSAPIVVRRTPTGMRAVTETFPPANLPLNRTEARRQRLRDFFNEYRKLSRANVAQLLGCGANTATGDLKALEGEGYIRRVVTSGNLRTSYFVKTGG